MPRLALAITLFLGSIAAGAAPPKRIVSLNLCADQYLIALADPAQIAAVTRLARDPGMSAGWQAAQRLPISRGSTEDVLALQPDLVLAMPGQAAGAIALLGEGRLRTLDVPPAESYAQIVAQVRSVAAAVGHPARGEALVRAMAARLAALPRPGAGRTAAYYQRGGYMTGRGTLIDELMRRVGLVNLAGRLGKPALARVSLEEMAVARPDYLIVESASLRVTDRGTELLNHPILAGIPRLTVPEAWTVCGGPAFVQAAESLARQLAARR